jgi:hypothetical protein
LRNELSSPRLRLCPAISALRVIFRTAGDDLSGADWIKRNSQPSTKGGNAIARETEMKKWRREKKVALIERNNPTWKDLAAG